MERSDDGIHPFLAVRGEPALAEGLSLPSAAPAPDRRDLRGNLADMSGDPNDLARQRWGVVITADDAGERALAAVKDLVARRGEQQGEAPHVYRVPVGMTVPQAEEFVRGAYRDDVADDPKRLPRYLLLLGDPDGVTWELQQALARHGALPGRLAFDSTAHYEAYAQKVLSWEARAVPSRKALCYAVRDGSSAVTAGITGLVAPCYGALQTGALRSHASIEAVGAAPAQLTAADLESEAHQMITRAAAAAGGLLVSLSHGVGLPADAPLEKRRAEQGWMQLHGTRALGPSDVAGPFFEAGAWFFFACFSAGTPAGSAYAPWLSSLRAAGRWGQSIDSVLGALPKPAAPFVAALPKAALASEHGPLGVIGHVDLAWSYSFSAASLATGRTTYLDRHQRFDALFDALLSGRRFGAALHELASASASIGQNLLALYGHDASCEGPPPAPAAKGLLSPSHRAYLWLEHHDLGSFVLLGDPAASLPAAQPPASARAARTPTAQSPVQAPIVQGRSQQVLSQQALSQQALSQQVLSQQVLSEQAPSAPITREVELAEEDVMACLSGKDPEELAPTVGRTGAELTEMVRAYRDAGRRALAEVVARSSRKAR